jgi:hypothetical protein
MDEGMIARLCLLLGLLLCPGAGQAEDSPPGCPAGSGDCGLAASGLEPFDAILVGHPLKVLSDDEMRALYRWAKARMWKDFPDDEADYLARNRVMLMPVDAEGRAVFVHMAVTDYFPGIYLPGALIRYTPRAMPESYYPDGRPIHSVLAGCVGVMCLAGDAACPRDDYPQGMFRFNDGIELDPRTQQPLANGRRIDPVSMRERAAELRMRQKNHTPQKNIPAQ